MRTYRNLTAGIEAARTKAPDPIAKAAEAAELRAYFGAMEFMTYIRHPMFSDKPIRWVFPEPESRI